MKNMNLLVASGIITALFASSSLGTMLELGGQEIDIHGFVSQGFIKSTDNNYLGKSKDGTFNFTEYALNASTFLFNDIYVGAQLHARSMGYWGSYEPKLDWGVVDYRFRDWLGFRAGRIKIPHGLYNETRDMDMLRTSIFLPQSVYNDVWRDAFMAMDYGGGIYGITPDAPLGRLSYQLYYGTLSFSKDSGLVEYAGDQFGTQASNFQNDDIWSFSLQWFMPFDGLRLGYTENLFDFNGDFVTRPRSIDWNMVFGPGAEVELDYWARPRVRVFSAEYIRGNLTLAAEYSRVNQNYRLSLPQTQMLVTSGDPVIEAYYGSLAYRFSDLFELELSYSAFYPNKDDRTGRTQTTGRPDSFAWLTDFGITGRFDISDSLIFKAECHLMNGTASLPTERNLNDDGSFDVEESWLLFMSKLTYIF